MRLIRPLDGHNFSLRELTLEDITEKYLSWLEDAEVNQYLETRFESWSIEKIKDYIIQVKNNSNILMMAIISKENKHIGNAKLEIINSNHRLGSISLFIGDKDYWKKNIATSVINRICKFAFVENKNFEKIIAGMYQENKGSYRAFLKAGFILEGIFHKQYFLKPGVRGNVLNVGLLKSDFKEFNNE